MTGERNANDLLKIIHENIQFNEALFTPNISSFSSRNKGMFICHFNKNSFYSLFKFILPLQITYTHFLNRIKRKNIQFIGIVYHQQIVPKFFPVFQMFFPI